MHTKLRSAEQSVLARNRADRFLQEDNFHKMWTKKNLLDSADNAQTMACC
jgi:hypothetical protein